MSELKLGFIGGGNMAGAILQGAIGASIISPDNVYLSDIDENRVKYLNETFHIHASTDTAWVIEQSDVVVLAVKPVVCTHVLTSFKKNFENRCVISIVAGWSSSDLYGLLPESARVLRVMPNVCALVGESMSVLCKENRLEEREMQFASQLFGSLGQVQILEEKHFNAVTGLSGSGPAYVFLLIEAMADAGVLKGLPRAAAQQLAAQTVLGAGKMVLNSGQHPGFLKDTVCSPGGTTIEGVRALESGAFRGTIMSAVVAAIEKAEKLK